MAVLQGLPLQDLPELVRDSHLEAIFRPNSDIPSETIHLKYRGTRRSQRERWIRQKILGRGGFGIVWLEKHDAGSSTTESFRAVKQLDMSIIRTNRRDCLRELEALAKFSQAKYSDFFVKSYGWFQSPSALFLAMEYCELGDLKNHVEEHGELAEDQVQDIGCQVLQGLRFMHDNNFAHRDLKPANILIKSKPPYGDWHVKICDLGLSKRVGADTSTTSVKGTPGFMPPESVPGIGKTPGHIDPFPADMWCFGEIIFYLLTHKPTFGGDQIRLLQYWMGRPFPKEPLLRVSASDAAVSFVQQVMARLPADRLTAEMADRHILMQREPFQEVEQDTGATSDGSENSSMSIMEDQASGRWTTGPSHQQGWGAPSGAWDSIRVDSLPGSRVGQMPISPRETEIVSEDGRRSSPTQMPDEYGIRTLTLERDIAASRRRKRRAERRRHQPLIHALASDREAWLPFQSVLGGNDLPPESLAYDEDKEFKRLPMTLRRRQRNERIDAAPHGYVEYEAMSDNRCPPESVAEGSRGHALTGKPLAKGPASLDYSSQAVRNKPDALDAASRGHGGRFLVGVGGVAPSSGAFLPSSEQLERDLEEMSLGSSKIKLSVADESGHTDFITIPRPRHRHSMQALRGTLAIPDDVEASIRSSSSTMESFLPEKTEGKPGIASWIKNLLGRKPPNPTRHLSSTREFP